MLARFFNDYEEIRDSTNKNRMPKPETAAEAVPDAEGDVDMLKVDAAEDVLDDVSEGGDENDADEGGVQLE